MDTNYKTEDGHYFDSSDLIFYIKWKIEDLKRQEYSDNDILKFDDSEEWGYYCKLLLKSNKEKYYVR